MTTTEKLKKVNEALISVSSTIYKVASISDMRGFQFDVVMNSLHMAQDELRKQRDTLKLKTLICAQTSPPISANQKTINTTPC